MITPPKEIQDGKGHINYIAATLLGLTIIALIYNIRSANATIKSIQAKDVNLQKEIDELKINLKSVMGNKYQSL
jgi:hypothetical protein